MNKIAIFVSGEGRATERIVRLFNEGNRVRTVLVIADDSASGLLPSLSEIGVDGIHIPDEKWHDSGKEVAVLIKEKGVRLIVLDNFELSLADEILEATEGEMVRVSSAETAPREVVAALEADLRKPVEKPEEDKKTEEKEPTLESEWADALKIQFTPPKVPVTPPEVPQSETKETDKVFAEASESYPGPRREIYNSGHRFREERIQRGDIHQPMPSTWLVWSVLVTIFCCFIPGIIAIIFSSQVSNRYYSGDYEGARRASRNAEIWIIVSVVLGVLAATLYVPFMFLSV